MHLHIQNPFEIKNIQKLMPTILNIHNQQEKQCMVSSKPLLIELSKIKFQQNKHLFLHKAMDTYRFEMVAKT